MTELVVVEEKRVVEKKQKTLTLEMKERVENILNQSPIVLFIKGDAERPFCKFSKQFSTLFISRGIKFSSFDVKSLDQTKESDKSLYEGIKIYGRFPTFPQIYVNKELIGGLDICNELDEENQLIPTIKELLTKDYDKYIFKTINEMEVNSFLQNNKGLTMNDIIQVNIRYVNGNIQSLLMIINKNTVENLYEQILINYSKFDHSFKKPFLISFPGAKKILDKNYLKNSIRECFSTEEFEGLRNSNEVKGLKVLPLAILYLSNATLVSPTPQKKTSLFGSLFSKVFTNVFSTFVGYLFRKPFEIVSSWFGFGNNKKNK
ncbi:hypothetical protein ABK040_014705 [Willaertia magna]